MAVISQNFAHNNVPSTWYTWSQFWMGWISSYRNIFVVAYEISHIVFGIIFFLITEIWNRHTVICVWHVLQRVLSKLWRCRWFSFTWRLKRWHVRSNTVEDFGLVCCFKEKRNVPATVPYREYILFQRKHTFLELKTVKGKNLIILHLLSGIFIYEISFFLLNKNSLFIGMNFCQGNYANYKCMYESC